jgi:hypothetical protein
MGKKTKRNKIENKVNHKTKEERIKEINDIKDKIESLGLSNSNENINELYNIFDNYIEIGIADSGMIKLPGLKREIHYILSNRKHIENSVNLKYNENI